jgi:hypothetical protein
VEFFAQTPDFLSQQLDFAVQIAFASFPVASNRTISVAAWPVSLARRAVAISRPIAFSARPVTVSGPVSVPARAIPLARWTIAVSLTRSFAVSVAGTISFPVSLARAVAVAATFFALRPRSISFARSVLRGQ